MSLGAAIDAAIDDLREVVRSATTVVPVGGRTHWEVGGPAPDGTPVRAPAGIVDYDPGELTVTLGAGTTLDELDAVVGAAGQQCPIDAREGAGTVGGALAVGPISSAAAVKGALDPWDVPIPTPPSTP